MSCFKFNCSQCGQPLECEKRRVTFALSLLRLLRQRFRRTIAYMPNRTHHRLEAAGRLQVESWLVCQGLITIRPDKNPKVSTSFPRNWFHN